jgi:hypothetical protein
MQQIHKMQGDNKIVAHKVRLSFCMAKQQTKSHTHILGQAFCVGIYSNDHKYGKWAKMARVPGLSF